MTPGAVFFNVRDILYKWTVQLFPIEEAEPQTSLPLIPDKEWVVESDDWKSGLVKARAKLGETGGVPHGATIKVESLTKVKVLDIVGKRTFIMMGEKMAVVSAPAPSPKPGVGSQARKVPAPLTSSGSSKQSGVAKQPDKQLGKPLTPLKKTTSPGHALVQPNESTEQIELTEELAVEATDASSVPSESPIAPMPSINTAAPLGSVASVSPGATVNLGKMSLKKVSVPMGKSVAATKATVDANAQWARVPFTEEQVGEVLYLEKKLASTEVVLGDVDAFFETQKQEVRRKHGGHVFLRMGWFTQGASMPTIVREHRSWRLAGGSKPGPLKSLPPLRKVASVQATASFESTALLSPTPLQRSEPPEAWPAIESTGAHSDKLAQAFEAMHPLDFLQTPKEGIEFTLRVLEQLLHVPATEGWLYDINTDVLLGLYASGQNSERVLGQSLSAWDGILGIATEKTEPFVASPPESHPNYKPALDGLRGISFEHGAYGTVHREGQLFGVMAVFRNQKPFSEDELSILGYVARKYADYLYARRALRASWFM